jgi:hypothetical protein
VIVVTTNERYNVAQSVYGPGLQLGDRRIGVLFPTMAEIFPFTTVQTGSEVHPAFYTIGEEGKTVEV